ncbi:MAG: hypothetical protein OD817_07130 [Gammaproteobacteria bacterium]
MYPKGISITATRAEIAAYLRTEQFARIYREAAPLSRVARRMPMSKRAERLCLPVGAPAKNLQRDMEMEGKALILSIYTIRKQKWEHPEIAPADYAIVQRILDGARIYRQSETHRVGFAADDDGNWWTAAWKKTQDGGEAYLLNLRRCGEQETTRAAQKYGKPLKTAGAGICTFIKHMKNPDVY